MWSAIILSSVGTYLRPPFQANNTRFLIPAYRGPICPANDAHDDISMKAVGFIDLNTTGLPVCIKLTVLNILTDQPVMALQTKVTD